jgi:hypothetical protein
MKNFLLNSEEYFYFLMLECAGSKGSKTRKACELICFITITMREDNECMGVQSISNSGLIGGGRYSDDVTL